MTDIQDLLVEWKKATDDLKYGVQRVFHDVFVLAAAGETTLIYGRDYRDSNPCLVNTVGTMLTVGGGSGIPSLHFGRVVELFDAINRELHTMDVNPRHGYVDPLGASIFLNHFAPLKMMPEPDAIDPATMAYTEPSDEYMAARMVELFTDQPCSKTDMAINNPESFGVLEITRNAGNES